MAEKRTKRKNSQGGGHRPSKREQEQKHRQTDPHRRHAAADNPAKAVRRKSSNSQRPDNRRTGSQRSGGRRNVSRRDDRMDRRGGSGNTISKTIGLSLASVQLIASLVFMVSVFMLNMLPSKYIMVLGVLLLILLLAAFLSQFFSKKKGISGKILSVVMSGVLAFGSFYMFKTNGMVAEISGGDEKLDNIVVAVLADDPAETIEDAASYQFGVQYSIKGDEIRETVSAINEELGSEIAVTEYRSVQEQATALHEKNVQAIIYNEAYNSILTDEFSDYSNSIKFIYKHEIKSKVENKAAEVEVENESFVVYISGIDIYGAIETTSRSDVNILAAVNPATHQILLVTTPRDYYVEIPGISGGEKDKLTHAGIYGVDASMATLSQLYDTDIDFYARVNFTSLVELVDALGGVDVVSEQEFTTSEDSGLVMNVQQGVNHFNGQEALAFSRERQNVDGGDFQRGRNQQAVITAMIQKAISPAILMGANEILNSVSGNVDTNMSSDQIQTLVKSQLDNPQAWNIKSMSAEGTGDNQECYSMPGTILYVTQPDMASVEAIKAAIDSVENGEVLQDSQVVQ